MTYLDDINDTLYDLMMECRNYFQVEGAEISGEFTISGGSIGLRNLLTGQYYIIKGSVFNDGLHQAGSASLTDETFCGSVIPLAVPEKFLKLAERVSQWQENNAAPSAFQSESFGGYSYTRATGSDGGQLTWQDAFRKEIAKWRKL